MSLLRQFLNWVTGKDKITKDQLKEAISDLAPQKSAPLIRTIQDLRAAQEIRTLQDLTAFCEEVRKTLAIYKNSCEKTRDASWIHKKAADSLYVEVGNLSDKIARLIESQKGDI